MKFTKEFKDDKTYAVFMEKNSGTEYYVCDLVDDDTDEAKEINELGLTLRARLTRSKGEYAMLEGTIFNPNRLLDSAVEITNYRTEDVPWSTKEGHTFLTITVDKCENSYLIFGDYALKGLLDKLKKRVTPRV